jgi:alpha-N-arabinofuranosidase
VPASAWLHGGGRSLSEVASLGRTTSDWTPAEVTLEALRDSDNSTLTIDFEGPGKLWLDRVSLIGDDAVLGLWRPDVIEAVRALNPGAIRWGGSTMEGYEWQDCLGPWDRRAPFTTCWGGLEPNFVGMEEFVQLCHWLGAEPLLCLRWTGKTPADAAAQVEYFNGPADSEWGRRRAANGHPEPYGVRFWQIGNEVSGEGYDVTLAAFAAAMKAKDPTIKVLSSFLTDQTLPRGGGLLDYLCPHHYGCADLAGKEKEFAWLREQIAESGDGRDIRVAVTEWNTTAGDWGLGRATLQALANALACARYQNLLHRHADLVEIAIRSNLVDSFGSGVILTGPGWLYLAPTYHAQRLYQRAAGSFPLRLVRSPQVPWQDQQPDLSAVLSPDGRTLRLYAVNATGIPIRNAFRLEGLGKGVRRATAQVLKDRREALCAEVLNTRDDPDRVAVVTRKLKLRGTRLEVSFEPYSLTLLELEVAP